LSAPDDVPPPFGGLVPCTDFARDTVVFELWAETCPVHRATPGGAPASDGLHGFALVVGRRFPREVAARRLCVNSFFGMEAMVSNDTIRPRNLE